MHLERSLQLATKIHDILTRKTSAEWVYRRENNMLIFVRPIITKQTIIEDGIQ